MHQQKNEMTKFLIIISILLSLNDLSACECFTYETEEISNLEYEIENSDWIGIGTILKADRTSYPAIYEVQIRINYKGSIKTTIIQTGLGGPDCGFLFEKNQEYIIYGTQIDEKTIETNRCSRTNKISDSIDFDYLNKKFKDKQMKLDWSENVTNFIQAKTNSEIDIANPPIIVNENYEIVSVENLIQSHPNYYTIDRLNFGSGELKRMNPKLRDIARTNGIIVFKSFHSKFKRRKLIRKLNRQIE